MTDPFRTHVGAHVPVAELFHENSKLPARVNDAGGSPFGQYHGAGAAGNGESKTYRTAEKTSLPPLSHLGEPISDVLGRRRSIRSYEPDSVTLWQVSQLFGWSYGIIPRPGEGSGSGRSAPSGGGLYPIELYVAAQRVAGLRPAVYHYSPAAHCLETVATDGAIEAVRRASLYPEIVGEANLYLIMVAVFARTCAKYGERGYRFVLLDCGHVAQNLHLVGTAIGLGSVGIGGFLDDRLNDVLELDGVNEAVVHTIALGQMRQ